MNNSRNVFEERAGKQGRPCFKDALFVFRDAALPDDLKVCGEIVSEFRKTPEAQATCIVMAHSVEKSAMKIDDFKNQNCGSGFTLAIFNLNLFDGLDELKFLMQKKVLGDPRTIFIGSMRHMAGPVYAEARSKIIREDELRMGAPSCIDSYGVSTRADVPARISRLAAAYLRDSEERTKVGKQASSLYLQRTSPAIEELLKIPTAFYGSRLKTR